MTADPHTEPSPDVRDQRVFASVGPIAMIAAVADRITAETGLDCTADLQHLVLITYLGLLDSPPDQPTTEQPSTEQPSTEQLLARCRRNLIIWAWEQGDHDQPLPIASTVAAPAEPARRR